MARELVKLVVTEIFFLNFIKLGKTVSETGSNGKKIISQTKHFSHGKTPS
jgi:hypothetical protein